MATLTKIFPSETSNNISEEFSIVEGARMIQVKGLVETDTVLVEYFFGDECDGCWQPLNWCCGQMKIRFPENQIIFPPVPGKYRLVLVKTDDDGNLLPFIASDFDDVQIQYKKIDVEKNLSDFYTTCCDQEIPVSEVTNVLDDGNVIAVHTNGNGDVTLIRETITSLQVNPDGGFTYTNEAGTDFTVPGPPDETVTTLVLNPDGGFTYTNENNTPVTVPGFNETVTTIVGNGNGGFTYTNENGTPVTIPGFSEPCPNPVVSVGCKPGGHALQVEDCDGNVNYLCPVQREVRDFIAAGTPYVMNTSSPEGVGVPGSQMEVDFTVDPDCPATVNIEAYGGWRETSDANEGVDNGRINFGFQYSLNGGAWTDLDTNGDYNLSDTDFDTFELEIIRQQLVNVPAGANNIRVRTIVNTNELTGNVEFTSFRHTLVVKWLGFNCVAA